MDAVLEQFLAEQLRDPYASFAVGTFGALAEFAREPADRVEVSRAGRGHAVVSDAGALRIEAREDLLVKAWVHPSGAGTSWSQTVALCLSRPRAAGPGRSAVTVLGPDSAALRPADRRAMLVDLGLGFDHLEACVRTEDAELLALLRGAAGQPLAAAPGLAEALVAAGPHRVFRTAVARAEVYTPIPPPDGTSPAGPHTHLLPRLLAHRRTHAATDPIDAAAVPVLSVFPAHPSQDALGRPRPFDPARADAFEAVLARWGDPAATRVHSWVLSSIRAGLPARAPAATLSGAQRQAWEVALRQLEAQGGQHRVWAAWRAELPRSSAKVPFHLAHDPAHG